MPASETISEKRLTGSLAGGLQHARSTEDRGTLFNLDRMVLSGGPTGDFLLAIAATSNPGGRGVNLRLILLASALVFFVLASCGETGELTRDGAAAKIEESLLKGSDSSYALASTGFERGVSQGYWDPDGNLTERGRAIATRVSRTGIHPPSPPDYRIEVTGITDAESPAGAKEVQFTLSNDGVSGPLRRFIIRGGTGAAILRRYDDGWRAENVRFNGSGDGLELSASDNQIMREEQEAELARRQAILRQATTPTARTTYQCEAQGYYGPETRSATVTDVSLELSGVNRQPGQVILYKDMRSIHVENFYGARLKMEGATLFEICPEANGLFDDLQRKLAAWRGRWNGVRLNW